METNEIRLNQHVGARIRLYRKQCGLNLSQLAEKLHLSKSTISKYESGRISLDVTMLFEIAKALNLAPSQLIDFPLHQELPQSNRYSQFFQRSNLFYLYVLDEDHTLIRSALEIYQQPNHMDRVTLFFETASLSNYANAKYIYSGDICYFDFSTTFLLSNHYNRADQLYICAKNPFSSGNYATALLCALSDHLRNPAAMKVLFSLSRIKEDDELNEQLSLSKFEINELRRTSMLLIY